MNYLDWIVLLATLILIVSYGVWKTRKERSLSSFLRGGDEMKWYTIGLGIMATQASAITFLSTPGQAYESGMGFIQFYFGLPIAMVLISLFFLPRYYASGAITAYAYLEERQGKSVRFFTAALFLLSRGLAAGITIYAPSIILSTVLGWNLELTNIVVGTLVILYTLSGGTKAVAITQKYQMTIILIGLVLAFGIILNGLPQDVGLWKVIDLAGRMGKMEMVDFNFEWNNRYNLLSGFTAGVFLFLSYFGTDQSQVQRYLGGVSLKESRLGLMFNGLFKIPLQLFVLGIGILVFVFYQYNRPPAFFNETGRKVVLKTESAAEYLELESAFNANFESKRVLVESLHRAQSPNEKEQLAVQINSLQQKESKIRNQIKEVIEKGAPSVETNDSDYIFLSFVLSYLPHGVIGLLIAVILSASMSSTAGELNALVSTTVVDFVLPISRRDYNEERKLRLSKWLTAAWGILTIIVALYADLYDNLIQLVNILGSLFYGTILGIFLVTFLFRRFRGMPTLMGGVFGQLGVFTLHALNVLEVIDLGYLWYNLIGCFMVIIGAAFVYFTIGKTRA